MRDVIARLFETDVIFDVAAAIWWAFVTAMFVLGLVGLFIASVHSIRNK